MNREKFKAICAKAIVAVATTSGILALGTQAASAQAMTVAVPFAFSAGDQNFPTGTYQFTFLSDWSLSVRNVQDGGEKFFTINPKENGSPASRPRVVFRTSGGQKHLEALYLPASNKGAELLHVSPKLQSLAQNANPR
jgi:hypothetical protein